MKDLKAEYLIESALAILAEAMLHFEQGSEVERKIVVPWLGRIRLELGKINNPEIRQRLAARCASEKSNFT